MKCPHFWLSATRDDEHPRPHVKLLIFAVDATTGAVAATAMRCLVARDVDRGPPAFWLLLAD